MIRKISKLALIANKLNMEKIYTNRFVDNFITEHSNKYGYNPNEAMFYIGDCPNCKTKGSLCMGGIDKAVFYHCEYGKCTQKQARDAVDAEYFRLKDLWDHTEINADNKAINPKNRNQ